MKINKFREHIEKVYSGCPTGCGGSFDEMLCFELHDQPHNPRMRWKSFNNGYSTGLTFKELAKKWDISVVFLGKVIAEHCKKLEEIKGDKNV